MDPLSQLPVECLERILLYVISTYDSKSIFALASLLRLNRHIFSTAIPFLYRYPFLPFHGSSFGTAGFQRSRALAHTLLFNIPDCNPHSTLTAELAFETTRTNFNPTRFNYLGYVRRLDLVQFVFIEYDAKGSRKEVENYSEDKLKYIRGEELRELYQEERRDACCTTHNTMDDQLIRYYSNVLYREAIWSLANPILGQLESLTFPLSDIRRYIQIVNQLGRLEHAVVVLDIPFYWICCRGQVSEATGLRREEAVRDAVQFVEDHRRIFPGCLKGFSTTANMFWHRGYTAILSLEIDLMVARVLPYHKPKYLAPDNWERIVAHRQATDLGSVRSILGLDPSVVNRQLLQQCRALQELIMFSLVDGCFDWAVQEKKDMSLGQGPSVNNNRVLATDPPQPAYLTHGLVPLERLFLEECILPSRTLDAMSFAFSQTLMDLQVEDLQGAEHIETIGFGYGWIDLPILSQLQLRAPRHRLSLDPLLLTQCPSLTSVTLKDETFEYTRQDVVQWLPAQLPKLRHLCLKGWSALTFSPNTLKSTKALVMLKLSMGRPNGYCFIPPVEELDAAYGLDGKDRDGDDDEGMDEFLAPPGAIVRPIWTWDWALPSLASLTLTSEFAYRFQFRMLKGCQALEKLHLQMRTVEGDHTRVITKADLFLSGADGSQDRIVAPKLQKLSMNGHWVFEDQDVMTQFLCNMFPSLYRLDARGWGGGIGVGDFVVLLRSCGNNIKILKTDLVGPLLTEEEEVELRICRRSSVGMKTKAFLQNRLYCSGVEYVLHKE